MLSESVKDYFIAASAQAEPRHVPLTKQDLNIGHRPGGNYVTLSPCWIGQLTAWYIITVVLVMSANRRAEAKACGLPHVGRNLTV